jgi:DNA-binding CsgD family transcriptional regulator
MCVVADEVELGRAAFERGAWSEAYAHLHSQESLDQDDLERLGVAAHLVGACRASELAWERAHRLAATRGDPDRGARCAFWLGFDLLLRGEAARANGWIARADRLAQEAPEGAAAGYVLLPRFLGMLAAGDAAAALELAEAITARAHRTMDADLLAFGLLCHGEALIAGGALIEGISRLDEVMVAVTTGEVSAITTGIIYCAVIDACMHAHDLRRAGAWTDALSTWCDADSGMVPHRGECLVHRSQVLMARGAWDDAAVEAERARAHLADPEHPALGEALYQQGELHRVRGELADAEAAYRGASLHGRQPTPGFALLRLAQRRTDAAAANARRMLHETRFDPHRATILAAVVEILVAARALDEATTAADELAERATGSTTDQLPAMASTARASLLLASGQVATAGDTLHDAIALWHRLDMPFEEARARALMSRVCEALGDVDAAELERDAAIATFQALGARIEIERMQAGAPESGLTGRECEVLRLVATGCTNREIASQLHISEHTVARHLQNIFVKLGVSSRAAATAYAYEHRIVDRIV